MTESKIPHFPPKICIQGNYTPKWGHSAMSSTDQPGLRAAQQKPFEERLFAHFCVNRDNSGHPGADGPKPKVKIETSIFNQCPGFCLIVFCLHGYCIWMCEWMNNRQLSVLPGLRWILLLSLWGVRLEAVRDNLGPYIRRSTVRRSRVRRSWVLDIFQIFSRSLHSATTAVVSNSSFWNCWNLF